MPHMTSAVLQRVDQIPVIDFGPFRDGSGKQSVADAIRDASESIGFFYLKNHGLPQSSLDEAFAASHQFFDLPVEQKLSIKINRFHRGYVPLDDVRYKEEYAPNHNESLFVGLPLPVDDPAVTAPGSMHGPNQWPTAMPELRPALERYHAEASALGQVLLRACALALGLDEAFFRQFYTRPATFVRTIRYPAQPAPRPENKFGAGPHSDYGCITILAQDDAGGLQVKARRGDGWIDAKSLPGTLVINIGDMLMRWTNDRWVSTQHRVINTSGKYRYSIAAFVDPDHDTLVKCIDSCQGPGNPARYPPITQGEYLKQLYDKTYAYRKKAS
jgi:isopenicillin N synthase-like dioxygenase